MICLFCLYSVFVFYFISVSDAVIKTSFSLNTVQVSTAGKTDIEEALNDDNVDIARDTTACNYAIALLRIRVGSEPLLLDQELRQNAERWAVYLASTLTDTQNILHSNQPVVYNKPTLPYYGELMYYAEDLDQAPGCNMAAVAWLHRLQKKELNNKSKHTKAVGGNFDNLLWKKTTRFGYGLSYNRKRRSGFLVLLLDPGLPNGESISAVFNNENVPEDWDFLQAGLRNPILKPVTFESNLGHTVCYSRDRLCDKWKEAGDCKTPAFHRWMHNNCQRSCLGCIRGKTPIDGGWSNWSQVTSCSKRCGGGDMVFYRFCKMPPAINSGKQCEGLRVRHQNCNMSKC